MSTTAQHSLAFPLKAPFNPASSMLGLASAIALLVTGRQLQGASSWWVIAMSCTILLSTLYLHWLWRRAQPSLQLSAEGIATPNLWTGRNRHTPWTHIRTAELLQQHGMRTLRLHRVGNPFALVLPDAAFVQAADYDTTLQQICAGVPAQRIVDRTNVRTARPYVTLCWVLLLLATAVAARVLNFDSNTLQQVAFGALQPELVTAGDWFRLHSFALVHADMWQLALTLILSAAVGVAIEVRLGHLFTAMLFTGSNLGAGLALLAFGGPALQFGAIGACYGSIGAAVVLAVAPDRFVEPMRRLGIVWWWALLLLLQAGGEIVAQRYNFVAPLAGFCAGTVLTVLHLHATAPSEQFRSVAVALNRMLALAAPASFVAACVALIHAAATVSPSDTSARLLQTHVPAVTVLDLSQAIASATDSTSALQARAFVALSDPNRAGTAALDSGSPGIRRADTLALLAWRQSMLAEARAHGLDAVRRAENEPEQRQQQLWARLATYEASARLPAFVPAAVLVRSETLCVLVPAGNPRQYLRAVVKVQGKITGLLLGTVDPGDTRCIAAKGMPANAHVTLTAAERALLTSDLRLYAIDPARAGLPARRF